MGELSGGERNRLLLAKTMKYGGNFLLLDEPTNDLDLETLRVLEEALQSFGGCVLVVSHDRYFLNRVCTGILAFEGGGKVVWQEGDYDYYSEKRRERERTATPVAASKPAPPAPPKPKNPKKLTWKEERELESIEAKILEEEEAVAELEATFADPDFYANHGEDVPALTAKLEAHRKAAEALYARWQELEEKRG